MCVLGPDGHSDALPTYWFYHPRVGYGNASRYFEDYIGTQAHTHISETLLYSHCDMLIGTRTEPSDKHSSGPHWADPHWLRTSYVAGGDCA